MLKTDPAVADKVPSWVGEPVYTIDMRPSAPDQEPLALKLTRIILTTLLQHSPHSDASRLLKQAGHLNIIGQDEHDVSCEPRDDHGCWTASGYSMTKTPEQILAEANAAGGWLHASDVEARNRKECVSFVRAVAPGLGHASEWRQGDRIEGPGKPPIAPGTAIATFDKNERYPMGVNDRHHAAIFLGDGTNADGKNASCHSTDPMGTATTKQENFPL